MQIPQFPAAAMPAAQRKVQAAHFLATATWSILTMRGGRAVAAQGSQTRVTMRVFAKGCPRHALRDVLQALGERVQESGIHAGGALHDGPWYHKAAWWLRDSQSQETGDDTFTIFRELSDGPVTETNTVDDGCGSRTTIRWVWDATAVEDLSAIDGYGDQGFSVKIGGVSRDPETQLVSYYVSVTERKTQILPEDVTGETAFSTDYDASWLGLRGLASAPTDDAGEGVSVWDPAVQALGELVSMQWSRNQEDCTLNAQGRKRVAKRNVASGLSCSRTAFAETDVHRVKGAEHGLGHAPAAAGGVVHRYDQELREDNLYDTVDTKNTELPVPQARVATEEDLFGIDVQTQDRSVSEDPAVVTVGGGVSGGTTVEVTEGRLKNTTRRVKTEKTVSEAQVSEERTVFNRKRRQTTKSSGAAVPAAAAGDGRGTAVVAAKTPGGLKDVSVDEDEELFVGAASVSEVETAFESVFRYRDVHSLADRPPASFADGMSVETAEQRKPLGSKDIDVVIKVEKDVPQASTSDSKTLYQAESTVESVSAGAAGAAPAAAGGIITAIRDVLTPGGKHRKTLNVTEELHVPDAARQETRTPLATRITVSAANSPIGFSFDEGELGTIERRATPGGRQNTSKTTITDILGAAGFHSYEDHYLLKTEVHKQIVAAQGGTEARLVGRTLTSDSFTATDGGHWERTRTIETVPAARRFELVDKTTSIMGGTIFTIAAIDTHIKMVLFMNTTLDVVAAEANAFIAAHPSFVRTSSIGYWIYYFGYMFDVNVGLRPDKFGTWSGVLSMSAELVNKLTGQTTEVGG